MEGARRHRILLFTLMKKLVILSGAGVSAESGIATFRSSDGLWEQYRIEDVATPQAWQKNPALVIEFYNQRRTKILQAQPNVAHLKIAELQHFFDVTVITQNIDDLHERAGVRKIVHLHGEIMKKRNEQDENEIIDCRENQSEYDYVRDQIRWRPHIVWFGEPVPLLEEAIKIISTADIFIVIGTSLQVYPAASLIDYTPEHSDHFLIDPIPPGHIPGHFQIIPEIASSGMTTLYEHLVNGL